MKSNKRELLVASSVFFLLIAASSSLSARPEKDTDRIAVHQQRIIVPVSTESPRFEFSLIPSKSMDFYDLKISETNSPATFEQTFSSMARLSGDQIVVAWQDNRLGSDKVFAQLYDATGALLSGNALLIGRSDGYDLIEPKVVPDGAGGFFLGWRDVATGRVYVSRYSSSLTRLLAPFAVNDTLSANFTGPFDMDYYSDGRLAVVWESYDTGNNIDIHIFNISGIPISSILKVNSNAGSLLHWVPSIAVNKSGGMGVVWEDYRNGNADIFMRLLNQDGSPNGVEFGVVQAAYVDSVQFDPRIAYSSTDGFAATWLDRRGGGQKVFMQRVSVTGALVGNNVMISESNAAIADWDITMAVNSSGNFVVGWAAIGATEDVVFQRFSGSAVPVGLPITVNHLSVGSRWQPALTIGALDRIFCSWTDYRSVNADIFLGFFTSAGASIFSADKLVNDDSRGSQSGEPAIAVIEYSKNVIAFSNSRRDEGDIYLQLVGVAGNLIGANTRVNTDTIPALQNQPAVVASPTKILTVWHDTRAVQGMTGPRIFGRFAASDGTFSASDFAISDSTNIAPKRSPAVALSRNQTGFVAWIDNRYTPGQVLGRLVQDPKTLVGNEFLISSQGTDVDNDKVSIGRDSSDFFTVVWLSRGFSGGPTAIAARYGATGVFQNRFSFKSNMAGLDMTDLSAAVDDSGNVYLLWQGSNSSEKHLYLSVFTRTGAVKNATFEVANSISAFPQEPNISVDNNRFVVTTWIDSRSGKRVTYYQVYDKDMVAVGGNTPASSANVEFMSSPATVGYRGRGWFAWVDPRSDGLSVFLSQVLYSPTGTDDHNPGTLPAEFALQQNFPNPFNPSTIIQFSVPTRSRVDILIFNMLGQRIATLGGQVYEAGNYSVTWDGRNSGGQNVPSGVYLYKMNAGNFVAARKMTLLK